MAMSTVRYFLRQIFPLLLITVSGCSDPEIHPNIALMRTEGSNPLSWNDVSDRVLAPQTPATVSVVLNDSSASLSSPEIAVFSSNPELIAPASISVGEPTSLTASQAVWSIGLESAAGEIGVTTLTVLATSGANSTFMSFDVRVNAAPEITQNVGRPSVARGQSSAAFTVSLSDANDEANTLVLTATSGSPETLPSSAVQLAGSGATRSLVIDTTSANVTESGAWVTITLQVQDPLGAQASSSFQVFVYQAAATTSPPTIALKQGASATLSSGYSGESSTLSFSMLSSLLDSSASGAGTGFLVIPVNATLTRDFASVPATLLRSGESTLLTPTSTGSSVELIDVFAWDGTAPSSTSVRITAEVLEGLSISFSRSTPASLTTLSSVTVGWIITDPNQRLNSSIALQIEYRKAAYESSWSTVNTASATSPAGSMIIGLGPYLSNTDPGAWVEFRVTATSLSGSAHRAQTTTMATHYLACGTSGYDNYGESAVNTGGACVCAEGRTWDGGLATCIPDTVPGCMDATYDNYNPAATQDNGMCSCSGSRFHNGTGCVDP